MSTNKIKKEEKSDCDCPLCKAMEKGEDLSLSDYMKIMKDMKEKNIGIIGFPSEFGK